MNQRKIAWVILAGIILVFVGLAVFSISDRDRKQPYSPRNEDAFVASQKLVKHELKAPSTAKFASFSESTVYRTGNDEWEITSYVDSQNSFGAMLRTHYTIVITVNIEGRYWTTKSFVAK